MKKKVVLLLPSLAGGGAQRVILNLARYLDNNKFDINLVVLNLEGPYKSHLPENISVFDLKITKVRYAFAKLIKILNKLKPDHILSTIGHLNFALIACKPFLKGNPRIIVREANTPSEFLAASSYKKRLLFNILYRNLYPKADLIIAQSNLMKIDLTSNFGISHKKITRIYNPIDILHTAQLSKEFNPFKSEESMQIVAVGKLSYQKGFDILLNAMYEVVKTNSNVVLNILGEGQLKLDLESLAKKLGIEQNVKFLGFCPNPYLYIKYADLFVLSSRWEGFPNVLLEALACGQKVISTDCKSGPSEIILNNNIGELVKVGDYFSLGKAILNGLEQERKYDGLGRAKDFDVKSIVSQYEKIFN